MKKVILLFLTTLIAVVLVACNSEDKTEQTEGTSEPESRDKIIVGIDDSFPPMGFRDGNNEIAGFDIDYARAAAEEMGVDVEFQPIDWASKETELMSGRIDLIWNGYTITNERKAKVLFTKPYLANSQVVLTLADSELEELTDLTDKNIGVQAQSSALDAWAKHDISKDVKSLVEFKNNVLALTDLKTGRIDAVVLDEVVANYYNTLENDAYKVLEEHLAPEEYGVGVAKENEELLEKLQQALNTLSDNGKAEELSVKWFGENKVLQ